MKLHHSFVNTPYIRPEVCSRFIVAINECCGSEDGTGSEPCPVAASGVDLHVTGEMLIHLVVSWFPLSVKMRTTFCVHDVGQ